MTDEKHPSNLCDGCNNIVSDYLEECQRHSRVIQVLVDLSLGITSDEGISSEAISRIGGVLSEFLSKQAALDGFFFGAGTAGLEHFDSSVIDGELAILKQRYILTDRPNNEI